MTPAVKATAIRDAAHARFASGRNTLALDQGHRGEYRFTERPKLITNRGGAVVGVDATVNVFDGATERQIDPHRIAINPPVKVQIALEDATEEDELAYDWSLNARGEWVRGDAVAALRYDPWQAYLDWLTDSVTKTPNPAGFRTRGTVTTVYATSATTLYGESTTYSTARETGFAAFTPNWQVGQDKVGSTFYCMELYAAFDTSSIGSDTISSAVLAYYVQDDQSTTDFTAQARLYPSDPGTLDASDYIAGSALSGLTLLATLASSGVSATAYNDMTESGTALVDNINKGGTTRILFNSDRHLAGTVQTGKEKFYDATKANAHKLTITHAAAAVTANVSVNTTTWSTVAASPKLAANASPAASAWTTVGLSAGIKANLAAVGLTWQTVTPSLTILAPASINAASWAVVAALARTVVNTTPNSITWSTPTPDVFLRLTLGANTATWTTVTASGLVINFVPGPYCVAAAGQYQAGVVAQGDYRAGVVAQGDYRAGAAAQDFGDC